MEVLFPNDMIVDEIIRQRDICTFVDDISRYARPEGSGGIDHSWKEGGLDESLVPIHPQEVASCLVSPPT